MSGTMIQFTRGENPLRADKLNAALAERLWRNGDTMTGSLFLWRDPQAPSEAATKQYVDGQINSVVSGTVVRAVNGRAGYVQLNNGDITTALGYTPYDAANPAGYISAASAPVRSVAGKQGTVTLVHTDITDWAATLAPYALIASIPIAATTLPLIAGVAAVGVNGAWARADHVHPSEVTGASFLPTTYQSGGTVDYNTLLSSTTGLNSLHQFGGPLLSANGPSGGTADKGTVLVTYAANTSWTSQLFLGDGGNVVNQGIWYRQMDGGGTWTGMAWHRIITDEGGVMLGSLTLAGDPTAPLMAVTKQYVDVVKGAIEDYLPLTGGTLSGKLVAPTMIVQPGWSSGFTVNLYPDADGNFIICRTATACCCSRTPSLARSACSRSRAARPTLLSTMTLVLVLEWMAVLPRPAVFGGTTIAPSGCMTMAAAIAGCSSTPAGAGSIIPRAVVPCSGSPTALCSSASITKAICRCRTAH